MASHAAGGLLAAEVLAPPEVMKKRLASQVSALWGAVRQRSIFLPAVFVFLWQVSVPFDSQQLSLCILLLSQLCFCKSDQL